MKNDRVQGPVYDLDTGQLASFGAAEPGSIPPPVADRVKAAIERDPILRAYVREGAVPATFAGDGSREGADRVLRGSPLGRQILKDRERQQAGQMPRNDANLRQEARQRVESARSPAVVKALRATPAGRARLEDLASEELERMKRGLQ